MRRVSLVFVMVKVKTVPAPSPTSWAVGVTDAAAIDAAAPAVPPNHAARTAMNSIEAIAVARQRRTARARLLDLRLANQRKRFLNVMIGLRRAGGRRGVVTGADDISTDARAQQA